MVIFVFSFLPLSIPILACQSFDDLRHLYIEGNPISGYYGLQSGSVRQRWVKAQLGKIYERNHDAVSVENDTVGSVPLVFAAVLGFVNVGRSVDSPSPDHAVPVHTNNYDPL
jgi:hypothetical protein